MSGAMTHPHPHRHYHVNWYFLITLLVAVAVIGGILVIPYIAVPKTAVIPVTGNQNAYAEYLLGEKETLYAMPLNVGEALTAYHLGEKTLPARLIVPSNALVAYHFGEKHVMNALDYALLTYRMGEKDY
jgi:hypothetical protein